MEHYFVDLDQTQIHTKDKSVRFCFKLLFFCAKNNKLIQQLILLIYEAKLLISVLELCEMGQVQKLLDDIESHVCCCTVLVLYLEAEES